MSFDTTILTAKIEAIKKAFENGGFADAFVAALNTGNGLLQQRVFSVNVDTQGNSFGKYVGTPGSRKSQEREIFKALFGTDSATDKKRIKENAGQDLTSYQRKRVNKGRQIAKKDLELTGGLRRAIETQVENQKAAVLQFNNTQAALIARGQEAQIFNLRAGGKGTTQGGGIKIFGLDSSERQQVNEQATLLLKQILRP